MRLYDETARRGRAQTVRAGRRPGWRQDERRPFPCRVTAARRCGPGMVRRGGKGEA